MATFALVRRNNIVVRTVSSRRRLMAAETSNGTRRLRVAKGVTIWPGGTATIVNNVVTAITNPGFADTTAQTLDERRQRHKQWLKLMVEVNVDAWGSITGIANANARVKAYYTWLALQARAGSIDTNMTISNRWAILSQQMQWTPKAFWVSASAKSQWRSIRNLDTLYVVANNGDRADPSIVEMRSLTAATVPSFIEYIY